MAGLEEVARAAGVAKSTVSRAMIHPGMVAPATRERILSIAAEMGLTPNRAARSLTTGRTGLVGLMVPSLGNPFFAPLISAAQESAEANDQLVLVVTSELSPEREARLLQRLPSEVDGLVLVTPRSRDAVLTAAASVLPLVLVDRMVEDLPAVLIDTPAGVGTLTDRLIADGHDRLVYVSGPPGSWVDVRRRRAVRARARAAGVEPLVLGPVPPTVEAGMGLADAVLYHRATACVGYNSSTMLGLIHGLAMRQVAVPDDITVACADDFIDLSAGKPAMPSLRVPVAEAGRLAMSMLSSLLAGTPLRSPQSLATDVFVPASEGMPGTA